MTENEKFVKRIHNIRNEARDWQNIADAFTRLDFDSNAPKYDDDIKKTQRIYDILMLPQAFLALVVIVSITLHIFTKNEIFNTIQFCSSIAILISLFATLMLRDKLNFLKSRKSETLTQVKFDILWCELLLTCHHLNRINDENVRYEKLLEQLSSDSKTMKNKIEKLKDKNGLNNEENKENANRRETLQQAELWGFKFED